MADKGIDIMGYSYRLVVIIALALGICGGALAAEPDLEMIGKVRVRNGGTGADNAADARLNLLQGSVTAVFYAKDYGSCRWDATNDVGACINLAIAAAVAAGGGTIVMPLGIFGLTVAPSITAHSIGIQCAAPSVTEGAGQSTVNANGTELKWIGASGGRMMSVATSAGQLLGSFVKNCRFNGNAGLAADGLYVASTFGGHFDDLTFFGGFNGGTVFNLDVNALAAGDAQNNTYDNLYLNNASGGGNGPGPYTSDEFRLGGFMDGTGQHGNASYNSGRNIFIAGDAATTGILCVGCDANRFTDVRVFNSGTSIDLTIAQSGAHLFAAAGNIFDHAYYSGAFKSRGTASFPACSGITCAYNNSLSIDSTNGTPAPTIEAGSFLHWSSNSGYWVNFSLLGKAAVQPAFFAAHDASIWGACRDNARTYSPTGVAYFCDSAGGNLLFFDDVVGDRFTIRFYGASGSASLFFENLAGTGEFIFNRAVAIGGLSTGFTNIGQLGGSSDYSGIAFTTGAPADVATTNYSLLGNSIDTYVNAPSGLGYLRVNNVTYGYWAAGRFQFGNNGAGVPVHVSSGQATAPALTSCGTGSPAIVGTDTAGKVTMGTTATGCVITFNVAYAAEPHCVVTWQATPLASQSYSVAAGAITLTQTSTSGNIVNYVCIGRSGG